jgi:hypothetical protein
MMERRQELEQNPQPETISDGDSNEISAEIPLRRRSDGSTITFRKMLPFTDRGGR